MALGRPANGYPFGWYLAPWIEGENPAPDGPIDLCQLAVDLAEVVRALHRIDTTDGPTPRTAQRGGPLVDADRSTRARAEQLRGETDVDGLLAVWEAGVHAPAWERPPVWVHGDLSDGNLLTRDGRLAGIIDWGGLLVGDPAVELMCAWNLFDGESRAVYLDALGFVDHATWLRGRAWAVSAALQALPYYRDTNPDIVTRSWRPCTRPSTTSLRRGEPRQPSTWRGGPPLSQPRAAHTQRRSAPSRRAPRSTASPRRGRWTRTSGPARC